MKHPDFLATWVQSEAIELCRKIEAICPQFGCHVALTGGLLYKDGPRKDCDILFYRIRQVEKIDFDGLWIALEQIGFVKCSGFGWCHKAKYGGKNVDCFSPEEEGSDMGNSQPDLDDIPVHDSNREPMNVGHICGNCKCVVKPDGCGCDPHDA